jgi:zinc and cadmium transporter
MRTGGHLILYSTAIVAASLLGGAVPQIVRLSHRRMECIISFVTGFMFGIGMLHLLPNAIDDLGSVRLGAFGLVAGFVSIFLVERWFRFHHHGVPEAAPSSCIGAALGLTIHSILGGASLAAAVQADAAHASPDGASLSMPVFLAILFHRPFDSLSLLVLMAQRGVRSRYRHAANALFSLAFPLGSVVYCLGSAHCVHVRTSVHGLAMAFAAGTFLCIATGDLMPELKFHAHDRFLLTAAFVAGIGLASCLTLMGDRGRIGAS